MWDLIVSVPDHCLSFYFSKFAYVRKKYFQTITDECKPCLKYMGALKLFYFYKTKYITWYCNEKNLCPSAFALPIENQL